MFVTIVNISFKYSGTDYEEKTNHCFNYYVACALTGCVESQYKKDSKSEFEKFTSGDFDSMTDGERKAVNDFLEWANEN